jgi:hypothetical protein
MLWPFSPKFYKFFSDREGNYRYDQKHLIVSWTLDEVRTLHQEHGNEDWIQDHLRHHASRWHRPVVTLLFISVILYLTLFLISVIIRVL